MPGAYSYDNSLPARRRGQILLGVVTALFLALVGRLYYFQVIRGALYQTHSDRNSIRVITQAAPRGLILDRHGATLAENRTSYTIAAVPIQVTDAALRYLSDLIDIDLETIREKTQGVNRNQFRPIPLRRDATFEMVSRVEEHQADLPGVVVQVEQARTYPLGRAASHLLGYIGEVNKEQLEKLREEGYQPGDLIGKNGVEKAFERFLSGKHGLRYVEVNALGQELGVLREMTPIPPTPGQNVYLTLDTDVQMTAEQAIPDSMAGALVAIDPNNGEILAFVSKPNYDPNLFPTGIARDAWNALRNDPLKPLINRASDGLYPSASTMKIVTAAAGLEEGLIDESDLLAPCAGGYQFGTRWARCWHAGHGSLSMIGAIAHSCDVYFYQLGLRIGLERWTRYARAFGLGSITGIDTEDEQAGLIPDMSYYKNASGQSWAPGKMLNLAIGQGEVLVTPLQMAVVAAAVANGGVVYSPYVLHYVRSPMETMIVQGGPSVKGYAPLSPHTLSVLQQSMIAVINAGTGGRARIQGVQVAGKTGTAENPRGDSHSWFIAYAPASHPTIAVAVIVENAPHGTAVPIARQVIETHLKKNPTAPSVSMDPPPGVTQ